MKKKILKAVPFIVFILLLASTFGAWRVTQNVVDMEIGQNFNQEVQVAKHWMQDRLNLYIPIFLSIRIFFESGDSITANDWSTYVQRLKLMDKYPAVSSLIYIERVKGSGGDSYLVKYIEPLSGNEERIGTDLSKDQKQLDLLNSVRDEDPTSTGRVTLITTPKKGFEIILPIYQKDLDPVTVEERRAALKGFVQANFEGSRLFQNIFDVVDSTNLSFRVYQSSLKQENLLYQYGPDYLAADSNYKPKMTIDDNFEFNGQTWYLVASTKPNFKLTPSQERLPWIVLGGGIVASFIFLGTYLYIKKQSRTPS